MSFGRYLLGAGELALIAAAVGFFACRLRGRLLPAWSGAPARLAEAVIAVAAVVLVMELLGTVGLFEPAAIVVGAVLVGIAGFRIRPVEQEGEAVAPAPAGMGPSATGIALFVCFLVAAHWATFAQQTFAIGHFGGDENWYHLPYAGRFAQEGSLVHLQFFSPSYMSWFHPVTSELFHSLGMLAFDRDLASPFLNLLWLALALLAGWCLGRPFGVAPLTAVATALVMDLPVFATTQAGAAMSDLWGVTFLLCAAALLVNGWKSERLQPGVLAVAGLAAGLAIGGKIVFVAPVAAILVGLFLAAPAGGRVRTAVVFGAPMLLVGSYWYLRNLFHVGNPLPYVSEAGPINLPGPDQGLDAGTSNSVAHYLTDGAVWDDHFLPGFDMQLGPLWWLLLGLAAVGVIAALVQNRSTLLRILAAAATLSFVFWLFAPAAAEGPEGNPIEFPSGLRVLVPALVLALGLAAIAARELNSRGRWIALGGLAVLALAATHRDFDFWESGRFLGMLAIAALLVLVPAGIAWIAERWDGWTAAIAGALAIGLAIGVAWPQTEDYLRDRYRSGAPPLFEQLGLAPVYEWASDLEDTRIGTSGILQYGLYGEDQSNHVQFLGRHGDDESFRKIEDCPSFRKAINDGDYEYVVASPAFAERKRPQIRWATDPNSEPIIDSPPLTVFRITGNLDPGACRAKPLP